MSIKKVEFHLCLVLNLLVYTVILLEEKIGWITNRPSSRPKRTNGPLGVFLPLLFFFLVFYTTAQNHTFPIGGQRGTTFKIEITGLESAHTALFCCHYLTGKIRKTEEKLILDVSADLDAELGIHTFRLISPEGLSRPWTLQIHSEPSIDEMKLPHNKASLAQLVRFPVVVNGTLSQAGDFDYYAIEVLAKQELRFELITTAGIISPSPRFFREPELVVLDPTGSWFNPQRSTRIECQNESMNFFFDLESQVPHVVNLPRLIRRFEKKGLYLLRVGSDTNSGGPGYGYQLRIRPTQKISPISDQAWTPRILTHPQTLDWQEREFTKKMLANRIDKIQARGPVPKKQTNLNQSKDTHNSIRLSELSESINKKTPDQAPHVQIPSLIEGSIEKPGDVDYFRFSVKTGDNLAFEVRTLETPNPYFSPRLSVFNKNGQKLFTNFFRYLGGDGDDWGKSLEPKTLYTFKKSGEYYLQIRDLTVRNGNPSFVYQILIRHQIPHIGKVNSKTFRPGGTEFIEDRINLPVGKTKTLTLVFEREEGFDGDISIFFDNLPPGVKLHAISAEELTLASQAGQTYEERATLVLPDSIQQFRPKRQAKNVLLLAELDAPITTSPQLIKLSLRAIANGISSGPIPVQEMWLMVTRPEIGTDTK